MDEKKIKALAAEFAKGIKTEADLNQFTRMLTKLTVETALNTYSSKTLLTDDGKFELSTPRNREGSF